MKKIDSKLFQILAWSVFCLYLLLLAKAILFKYPATMVIEAVRQNNIDLIRRRILFQSNFIPVRTVYYYLVSQTRVGKVNIIANVVLFAPLGFILPLVKKFNKLAAVIGFAFATSLIFELMQLILGVGNFDVDDLILNSLGAMLGFTAFRMVSNIFSVWRKIGK